MSDSKGMILLVDDDPAILLSVGDQLQFEGYEVVKAESAEQALERLKKLKPDLIILDISMPGIGGMAFLKQISQVAGTMKYPVLVFTARAELDQFFAHTGVNGFLSKTTDPETLLKEIDHIMAKRNTPGSALAAGAAASGRRMRVMIAEDDARECEHLVNYFTRYGYEANGVSNSYAVIETAVTHSPDVILLKYIMPHVNGPAIAAMLGSMPSTQKIRVVLYDGSGVHDGAATYTNVRSFVGSADDDALLKAVENTLKG